MAIIFWLESWMLPGGENLFQREHKLTCKKTSGNLEPWDAVVLSLLFSIHIELTWILLLHSSLIYMHFGWLAWCPSLDSSHCGEFVLLSAPRLGCSAWDLRSSSWPVGSLGGMCGIELPDQGWNPGPPPWERRVWVLATGPPGKSLQRVQRLMPTQYFFKNLTKVPLVPRVDCWWKINLKKEVIKFYLSQIWGL